MLTSFSPACRPVTGTVVVDIVVVVSNRTSDVPLVTMSGFAAAGPASAGSTRTARTAIARREGAMEGEDAADRRSDPAPCSSVTRDPDGGTRSSRGSSCGGPGNVSRVAVQTEQEPQTAGELIRFWRTRRGLSQLELSLDANISTKHVSFVETGRSSPSRQLLVHLAQHLDLPITERNRLLLAGGFAPPYLELPYHGEVMQPLRESLERLLEAHEPNPALIVDGLWNLIESNRAASLLWDGVDPALLEPPINLLRLGVHPAGLPGISSMTAACTRR